MTLTSPDAYRSRPGMDASYGVMESADGMLTWAWLSQHMAAARNYWLCTTRPDGAPHAAPVWGLWQDDTLYFSTGKTSRKTKNIQHNPNVVVHLESGDEVVILEGVLRQVTDIAILNTLPEPYNTKYNFKPDLSDINGDPTYGLRVQKALAWLESDYPTTATRWLFANDSPKD